MKMTDDAEPPVEQIEIIVNPKHDPGLKIEQHHPLTIAGLMRNSEAECKASRLNFNEQRLLERYYHKLDADCSYVLRISNIDKKMAIRQHERLRARSSKVKSNLKPVEHARLQRLDEKGQLRMPKDSYFRSASFNSAQIIDSARTRLFNRSVGQLPSYLKKMKQDSNSFRQRSKVKFDFGSPKGKASVTNDPLNGSIESDSDTSESENIKLVSETEDAGNVRRDFPQRPLTTAWSTHTHSRSQSNNLQHKLGCKPGFVPFSGMSSGPSWTPRLSQARLASAKTLRSVSYPDMNLLSTSHYSGDQFDFSSRKQQWHDNECEKMNQLTKLDVKSFIDSLGDMKLDKPSDATLSPRNNT